MRQTSTNGAASSAGLRCDLRQGHARNLDWLPGESVHIVLTSPPYWTLKKYNDHPDQLGDIKNYETFMDELDKVWRNCYRVLVKGGRLGLGDIADSCGPVAQTGAQPVGRPRYG